MKIPPPLLWDRDLCSVLTEKYGWSTEDASSLTSFLTPMLDYSPVARATAHEALQHPWLGTS